MNLRSQSQFFSPFKKKNKIPAKFSYFILQQLEEARRNSTDAYRTGLKPTKNGSHKRDTRHGQSNVQMGDTYHI